MRIKQNFHFHSQHSCDSACAKILDIMAEMKEFGIEEFGLTDHIHTAYNLPDIISARRDFLASRPPENFHFGVEVSCMDQRECDRVAAGDYTAWGDEPVYGFRDMTDYTGDMAIGITPEEIRELGIEFVVGGVHWPLTVSENRDEIIRNYFEQQLFLLRHPSVNVLAHPWDSLEMAVGNWYKYRDVEHIDRTAFRHIPQKYNDALAEALLEEGKGAELNLAVLGNAVPEVRQYMLALFADWKRQGVKFTIGDDLHKAHFSKELFEQAEQRFTDLNFTDEDFVLPHQLRSN